MIKEGTDPSFNYVARVTSFQGLFAVVVGFVLAYICIGFELALNAICIP